MKNKRTILIAAEVLLLAAGVIFLSHLDANPVVRLEIIETSLELEVGDSVQLHVKGYTDDGKTASEEQMEKLPLRWRVRFDEEDVCIVDDGGTLTAVSTGSENVQVYCEEEDLYSRPITVSIRGE